ncbi:MAG: CotH protein [Erysipelotrichaceae bacterium]|nr:MAG: CotH [Erysipelotrichaceae bacterium]TXT19806.1 MAG: CotH protein [Erysipelotrichaceae bacterium]
MMKRFLILAVMVSMGLSACQQANPNDQPGRLTQNKVTATQDFFDFFDDDIYHEIVIEVKATQLNLLDQYMQTSYDRYGHYRISKYVKANFVYRENGKEKIRINEIGLRTHGNIYSRYLIQYDSSTMNTLHWRLSFDEPFDLEESTKAYEIRKKRNLYGLENLVLKWNMISVGTIYDTDPYIIESYGYQLYEQVGIPSSKASLVHVIFSIDGNEIDQGVMTMIEPVDDEFIQKRFSEAKDNGNLYKALWQMAPADLNTIQPSYFGIKNEEKNYFPAYDIKTNEDKNRGEDLKLFIKTYKTKRGSELYDYLNKTVELDKYMRFSAMNYLFGNPDDFRYNNNNYYLYFDSSAQPKLSFIPTDLDKGLGIVDWDPDGSQLKNILPYDNFTSTGQNNLSPLIKYTFLSTTPVFKNAYQKALESLLDEIFTYEDFVEAYEKAYQLYAQDISKMETRSLSKPMGIPLGVAEYYCIQAYKVINLKQPTSACN